MRTACILLVAFGPGHIEHFQAIKPLQHIGLRDIAGKNEFILSNQTRGRARMPGDKYELAIAHASGAPAQVMLHLGRFALFINPEQADIQIVARVLEIIGVASEEADIRFRRENQPHIRIAFVTIERILAALEERHHIAAQTSGLERLLLQTAHHFAPCLERLFGAHFGLDRRIDAFGHILDAHQDIELQIVALELLLTAGRIKPIGQDILFLRGKLLERPGSDVMIGNHQPVFRNKRARAAVVETNRRFLQMFQPLSVRAVTILGF